MITYFGALKDGISFSRVKKKLTGAGIKVLNYYPALKIVKFESEATIAETDFDFFVALEEEKDDFSV